MGYEATRDAEQIKRPAGGRKLDTRCFNRFFNRCFNRRFNQFAKLNTQQRLAVVECVVRIRNVGAASALHPRLFPGVSQQYVHVRLGNHRFSGSPGVGGGLGRSITKMVSGTTLTGMRHRAGVNCVSGLGHRFRRFDGRRLLRQWKLVHILHFRSAAVGDGRRWTADHLPGNDVAFDMDIGGWHRNLGASRWSVDGGQHIRGFIRSVADQFRFVAIRRAVGLLYLYCRLVLPGGVRCALEMRNEMAGLVGRHRFRSHGFSCRCHQFRFQSERGRG